MSDATAPRLRPLHAWPASERARIRGVFTDIDDTLTTDGQITPDALAALAALRDAGLIVVPITGRPVGWCEALAATWPVPAIVAENGAVALFSEITAGTPASTGEIALSKIYREDASTRARNMAHMQRVATRVLREVPGAALSRDSAGRETDIAFDVGEHQQLDATQVDAILARLRAEGLHTTRSSIHVHGAVNAYDKWSGAQWAAEALFGHRLSDELDHWVAVGDSINDEPLFRHFRHSIGVANVARFVAQLQPPPCYITDAPRGAGFAQLARTLLQSRA
ncbi:MAG: HAD-IIB family hydrolase [Tibeticola sp.]